MPHDHGQDIEFVLERMPPEDAFAKASDTFCLLYTSGPMILGNLLQQFYNITDTLIVGQFLGSDALAAVGSSFSLMTFLTSILLGLCLSLIHIL